MRNFETLHKIAIEIFWAGYSDCTFSDFEYYPIMAKEFPIVKTLTDEEENVIVSMLDSMYEADMEGVLPRVPTNYKYIYRIK